MVFCVGFGVVIVFNTCDGNSVLCDVAFPLGSFVWCCVSPPSVAVPSLFGVVLCFTSWVALLSPTFFWEVLLGLLLLLLLLLVLPSSFFGGDAFSLCHVGGAALGGAALLLLLLWGVA